MAQVSKDSEFDISSEFIESGKSFKTKQKKKGGSYTKYETQARRDEVHRLHFDYGYSARKIADLLKVSRNTINSDIDYWYSKILDTRSHLYPEQTVIVNLSKKEQQRIRIREYLDNCDSLQDKIAIEKMLIDIDFKVDSTYLKLANTCQNKWEHIMKELNLLAKKKKIDHRYFSLFETSQVSEKTHEKINKLIAEDMHKKGLRLSKI